MAGRTSERAMVLWRADWSASPVIEGGPFLGSTLGRPARRIVVVFLFCFFFVSSSVLLDGKIILLFVVCCLLLLLLLFFCFNRLCQ